MNLPNWPVSRRSLLWAGGSAALSRTAMAAATRAWPRTEGAKTPKLCMILSPDQFDERAMRRVKQLGVDHVLMGGPPMPWEEARIRAIMDRLKTGGLSLGNMMIGGFPNAIYGKPGRDRDIEMVQQSIRAAGRAGLPVVEYNFYAHRAVEGYFRRGKPTCGWRCIRTTRRPPSAAVPGRSWEARKAGSGWWTSCRAYH